VSPTIEAASNIGGSTVGLPGNCLAVLPEAQREAFKDNCTDPAACNVTVTAEDMDQDGENDDWMIDGIGIKALICTCCGRGSEVFGQTTLDIGYHVFKK